MTNFNSQDYFQQLITDRALVQVYATNNNTYEVGHLFSINDQEIVYSVYTSAGNFDGVCLAKLKHRGTLKTQTHYLHKFATQIPVENYYQRAQKLLANFQSLTWNSWLQTLALNKIPTSLIDTNDESCEGLVSDVDKQIVLIKELNQYADQDGGTACFWHSNLSAIVIGSGWLNTLASKLTKKQA